MFELFRMQCAFCAALMEMIAIVPLLTFRCVVCGYMHTFQFQQAGTHETLPAQKDPLEAFRLAFEGEEAFDL